MNERHKVCSARVLFALWFSYNGLAVAEDAFGDLDASTDEDVLLFEDVPSVFGASKYEQKITEAPARISIVTAEEIRRFGYRTLSDILRSLPGFHTSNDRAYRYTGVRGFGIPGDYDTRLLQLVNGHRINDNVYDSMFNDQGMPVDIDMIKRVEVVRGPSSSLYGSSAFFGVVNIITKQGRDIGGWEVSGAVGSHQAYQGRLTYGNRLENGLELLLSGTLGKNEGNHRLYYPEFDDPATNNGLAEDVDDEDFNNLFARVSWGDFTLEGGYGDREKHDPTGSYGTVFNARETRNRDRRGYLDLTYQTLLESGAELTARLHYDRYRYDGGFLYDYGDPGDPYLSLNKDYVDARWWGGELQWNQRLGSHHLILGTEYRDSISEEQGNYDSDGVYLDSNSDTSVWALYLQDEINLGEDLILNLGLRYDRYSNFGATTNPRAALIWSPLDDTVLKLIYGEAFRAPSAYESFYNDGSETQKPASDLEPETIRTYELVLEQQLADNLRGVASVYHNEIEELIALTTDPADGLLVNVNRGDATANGVELELDSRWAGDVVANLSYSYQHVEDNDTGERLVNYPRNMLKLNLTSPVWRDALGAGLEVQYEDGRLTLAGDESDSRLLVNLTLYSEQWVGGLNASATLYNLFDRTYGYPGSEEHVQDQIEQDGRTFRVKLDYAF